MEDKDKELNFDDILDEVGQFGWYQILTFILVTFPVIFKAMYNAQYVFAAGNVSFRCSVPECDFSPPEWDTGEWGDWALPEGHRRRCERWAPSEARGPCTRDNFDSGIAIPCTEWVFQNNNSIVAEFGLGCPDWQWTLVGSVHNLGVFFALPLTGYVCDRFGRRVALVLTSVSSGVMGLVRSFSYSYGMYLTFEFLDAIFGAGSYHTGFILVMEMVGPDKRVLCGNLLWSIFATGQSLVAAIAWAVPYWRTFTRVIYTPSIFFITYHFLLDESVRWLIYMRRKDEAVKNIYKIASINKKNLSPETTKMLEEFNSKLEDIPISIKRVTNESDTQSLVLRVLKSRVIVTRLLICSFWWICVTFIYYGLSINSVSLIGHSYIIYMLTTLMEIPGNVISVLTLDRFGRKSTIMVGLFVCGVSLLISAFVRDDSALVALTMLGMLCTGMVFSSIYIYTTELFPTEGRSLLVALCSMVGRLSSVTAPQTPLLVGHPGLEFISITCLLLDPNKRQFALFKMAMVPGLPYVLFGGLSILAGALMILTPETLHIRLPDTIQQAEEMAVAPRTSSHIDLNINWKPPNSLTSHLSQEI